MRKQIEHADLLRILSKGFYYFNTKNTETIKTELSKSIKTVRHYRAAYLNGQYDYLNSYPCGYQDSFYDKVNDMWEEFRALKLAYRLTKGDGETLHRLVKEVTGG